MGIPFVVRKASAACTSDRILASSTVDVGVFLSAHLRLLIRWFFMPVVKSTPIAMPSRMKKLITCRMDASTSDDHMAHAR